MVSDNYYLIIPASGIGSRMQTNTDTPKQYLTLDNGLTILDQTLKTLLNIKKIKGCIVAISNKDRYFKNSIFNTHPKLLTTAIGGKERYHSVINALEALRPYAKDSDWVLVHDAARACVNQDDVVKLINKLENNPVGGLLANKVVDTIKQAKNNITDTTIDRSNLWQAQTPQMYRFGVLSKALNKALEDNINITDEASSIEHIGLSSVLVESDKRNIKITNPEDLDLANFYLKNK